ncbi:conserved hypothetical protein [Lebetimonas natsushimae]|uniref:Uncharacterized protein n=1 Tax=Lebetimonas natsushimae TaxID=1936991 RepID=A0A292YD27_9BACT|nr:hypothetical protein [Lebetimonas natsushimae]GAX87356.1 conserved hypothetical protein [Lebetimonas natsushimae]
MKKIFPLFFFLVFSNASILYKNKNYCIEDFYYKNGRFYYLRSKNNRWYSTSTRNNNLEYGYYYDDDNNTCEYNQTLKELHIRYFDYYFLWGLSGLLIGFSVLIGFILAILS